MAKQAAAVRLLAGTNNQSGDLFTRLCGDLFFALGYDDLRYDVANSGRELDLQGKHRLEPRRVIAECKAQKEKSGGDALNKFFGSVSRERDRDKSSAVTAYFVSLSGFTETARTQEAETSDGQRLVLLDGRQVVDELIRIRVIVDRAKALERAGRCAQAAGLSEAVATPDDVELLGHELGYVWVVYYSLHKQRTHFALIHADGNALGASVAQTVIAADQLKRGKLDQLQYLPPPPTAADRVQQKQAAEQQYRRWVVTEFGDIQLDGLPADADLAALRIRLERLFVPLRLSRTWTEQAEDGPKQREWTGPVGKFLTEHSRFALLAKPGGGKSTLLKRLAVAYAEADAGRLNESNDGLPPRDWLPLLVRCRELKERAERPIRELVEGLPKHAGLSDFELGLFDETLDEALRAGKVLLLVDGLDEISNEGALKSFVNNLRTFLAMFPQVAFVVTSREAGYRHVAGVVASICAQTTLAPFNKNDVRRLCEAWHVQVVKDTETVRRESQELATKIWENERIRALAENPLMLTTLLVVRRTINDLPTKRVELYRETVKVFIRTWNTQGFEPMDLEDTQAQLSYVACAMLQDGVQQIGRRRLLELLKAARRELDSELGFTKISPDDFIDRVEHRSSLLMQTGHEVLEDRLQPVYEFRHLTFQEYLAARGFVAEQYPGRAAEQPLVELFAPHFEDDRWKEVIPLAAVLAGRKAEPLIRRLTEICEGRELKKGYPSYEDVTAPPVVILR